MKNIKRILVLTVVAMMLVAIAIIPASAAESEIGVQPRATCSYCGAYQSWSYSSWDTYKTETKDCAHYNYGKDKKYYDRRLVTVVCSGCSNGDSTYYEYRTRNICNGYNNA